MFAAGRAGTGTDSGRGARANGVTHMWLDIGIAALLIFAVYAFVELAGFRTRYLTHRTTRRAEDLYDQYADSPRKQHRYAREHGGSWHEGSDGDPSGSSR
jgi:hypothetical protein